MLNDYIFKRGLSLMIKILPEAVDLFPLIAQELILEVLLHQVIVLKW
jgi:hypothetical protein